MDLNEYEEIVKFLKGKVSEKDKKFKELQKKSERYEEKIGSLYRKSKDGKLQKVLRENELDTVLWMMHNHPTAGHFGIDNTYEKIKERFYWKNMKEDIKQYIKFCDACQRRGKKGGQGYLNTIKVEGPFEKIGIDFVGPLSRTEKGNRYILVAIDYLTKWVEAKALREATAKETAKFLYEEIICRHGCPKTIISDKGSHFKNTMIEELCKKFEIRHKMSSPYHPQTNGLVERFNRTLCESLAKISEKEEQWDEHINEALFAYRINKQSTTKKTPFYLMYGREARLPLDYFEENGLTISEEENIQIRKFDLLTLEEQQIQALENIKKSQSVQEKQYNEKIKEETQFRIGDKVLLKESFKEKSWTGKLSQNWKGPYYIHDVYGKGVYKLKTTEGKILKATQNVKNLKKYYDRRDTLPKIIIRDE
jgi:hypothetical protein